MEILGSALWLPPARSGYRSFGWVPDVPSWRVSIGRLGRIPRT